MSDISLPVSVDVSVAEITQGIFALEGQLRYAEETLSFEYRTKDLKSRDSAPETVHIALDGLRDVTLKRWPPGARLILRPRRLDALEHVPGATPEKLVFRVTSAHRERAERLADELHRVLSKQDVLSVPFQLPDTNLGMTENNGLLSLDEEFLVFDVGSSLPGGFQQEQQIIKIEVQALEEIHFTHGILRDHLHIKPKKRDLLDVMPGTHEEELKLSIRKKDRADAEQLVYEVRRLRRALRNP